MELYVGGAISRMNWSGLRSHRLDGINVRLSLRCNGRRWVGRRWLWVCSGGGVGEVSSVGVKGEKGLFRRVVLDEITMRNELS